MTLFNRDPNESSNLEELRQWVTMLQELLYAQKEINRVREQQNQVLLQANQQQGVEIELLREKVDQQKPVTEGLLECIAEYEALFSVKSCSSEVRMN